MLPLLEEQNSICISELYTNVFQNSVANVFQNSVAAKGREKTHESGGDSQNFHLTPGEVNQSRGITDTYANDTKHRSTHTMSLKNVDL